MGIVGKNNRPRNTAACEGQARCLHALYKLYQMRDATLKEITDFALEAGIDITLSRIGYIALLNDDESVLTMYSWSKTAMAECQIPDKPLAFPVKDTGLWGEAVRERKAIITNDYNSPCPYKKGYPAGHVAIKRHMNVPVFSGDKIVLVAGVGNKEDDYNEDDVEHLTLLMDSVWRFIERKRTQDAAIESERKFRSLFNHTFQFAGLLDIDGNLVEANQPALAFIGKSLSELKGQPFWLCPWWPKDKDIQNRLRRAIADAVKGKFSRYETIHLDKAGGRHYVDFSIKPLFDETGKTIMLIPEGRDITDRKQEERVMQMRVELMKFAPSHSLHELLTKTLDEVEKLTDSSISFFHFVKSDQQTLTLQAWSTRTLKEFCYVKERGMHYQVQDAGIWVDCVRQRRPVIHNDYASMKNKKGLPPGHAIVTRELVMPIMRNDKIVAILGIGNKSSEYTDDDVKITTHLADLAWSIIERKVAEEKAHDDLQTSQRQLAILTNIAISEKLATGNVSAIAEEVTEKVARTCDARRVSIWLFDDAKKVLRCVDQYDLPSDQHSPGPSLNENEYALELDALLEKRYVAVNDVRSDPWAVKYMENHESPKEITSLLVAAIRTSERQFGILTIEHDGQPHEWNHAEISFAFQIADQVALAILNGEHKKSIEQKNELERSLQHSQKLESLGVLAGGIAHDFNNILMTILGNMDIAMMNIPSTSPAKEAIDEAIVAAKSAANLTRQMLAYSGKGKFLVTKVDLNELIRENAQLFRTAIPRTVNIDVRYCKQSVFVRADKGQLQQVLMNLMTNAWESFGEKHGTIILSIGTKHFDKSTLSKSRNEEHLPAGDYAFIEIADTGCGMDDQTLQRMFDPFFSTKFTGRGLGLSAVLGIVKGHKGAILVTSKAKQGTTVQVLLPICSEVEADTKLSRKTFSAPKTMTGKVLIIDDDENIRKISTIFAEKIGVKAIIAADGEEGIRIYEERQDEISCVLTDLTMPVIDGAEVEKQIHAINPNVPVLLTSGYSTIDAASQFADHSFAGFIQKPYRIDEFAATLKSTLASK